MSLMGPYFYKKNPPDFHRKGESPSTSNIFGLPTYYQYDVGSMGFGRWREILAHEIATKWVLGRECQNFPFMYHWEVVKRSTSPEPPTADQLNYKSASHLL